MCICAGSGGCGDVHRGTYHRTPVAVKVLKLRSDQIPEEAEDAFLHEIKMMMKVRHTHIVPFLGVCVRDGAMQIVMELMSSDLREHCSKLKKDGTLTFKEQLRLCTEMALGFLYLHVEKKIRHRDIKAGNVLVNEAGTVKISHTTRHTQLRRHTDMLARDRANGLAHAVLDI